MMDNLENLILRTIERWAASRYSERHGLVTSYDPKTYMAKVKFMPGGQESGWLPIETGHVGNGFGIAIGLTPGTGDGSGQQGTQGGGGGGAGASGGGSQQYQGDQVIVRYQEGDIECGKIVQRCHSDQDKPPEVQSGEMVLWTNFKSNQQSSTPGQQDTQSKGCRMMFKKDGSIEITDGNGATLTLDGKGNVKWDGKKNTEKWSDTVNIKTEKDFKTDVKGQLTDNAGQGITHNAPVMNTFQDSGSGGKYKPEYPF